jgi:hypothetical protein
MDGDGPDRGPGEADLINHKIAVTVRDQPETSGHSTTV